MLLEARYSESTYAFAAESTILPRPLSKRRIYIRMRRSIVDGDGDET